LEHDDIPGPVRERVKDILLDTLASALAGPAGDETAQVAALAGALGRSDEAIRAHDLQAGSIEKVHIGLSPAVHAMHGTLPWRDKFKALLSEPCVASVILHDRLCWLEQFLPSRFEDPAVGAFARDRIRVDPDADLAGNAASIEVTLRDGRSFRDQRSQA
jgi:2-methylcitrate dehydratase PrpD